MLSGESVYTNFIVFGLIRSGFEPTISHTRGEYANHYTTDAVYTFGFKKGEKRQGTKEDTLVKHELPICDEVCQ